ncbi:NAD(P)/FAD-dependent oxidoreductase [[Mycoplasma] gypis]|uniref:FAD-dependent oxidoreductase n=1 Tax=[Mycoplasma] gypis TaxID=92404 RepID=A0ABZ2RP91_9BACT|nr:FAD-dependent oxidoreductase [[Mycoplasma] gypis]MBN0919013.1 FAD-dependent oxidoreductase [[Mycoplasma] gypis]
MTNTKTDYDVVIIGGGPAGLTASVYTTRSNLKTVFIEKKVPGGKLPFQSKIENWPGETMITGAELATKMFSQTQANGAEFVFGNVVKINNVEDFYKEVILEDGQILKTKTIIVASGMLNRIPKDIKGIEEFDGKGVSYCAICDGPQYKGHPIAIIGGGNSAIEEGAFVASFASKVYVFVRDKIIAEQKLVDELKAKSNVEILMNSQILEIIPNEEGVVGKVKAFVEGEEKEIQVSGVFPYIGFIPATDFLKDFEGVLAPNGFVITDENMETKIKNVYAVGDVRIKDIRQITTAVGDGTIAAKHITNKL